MDKKLLRKELMKQRSEIGIPKIKEYSDIIFDKIKLTDAYRSAKTIMIFVSYNDELDTHDFINYMIEDNKKVVTPICNKDHTMTLAHTKSFPEGFKATKLGILEIPIEEAISVDPKELDLIIAPGLAYTIDGERLGYGGGYYDRLFSVINESTIILSPIIDEFIIDEVPTEQYDEKVDIIISQNRVIIV